MIQPKGKMLSHKTFSHTTLCCLVALVVGVFAVSNVRADEDAVSAPLTDTSSVSAAPSSVGVNIMTINADFEQEVFDPISGNRQRWFGHLWLQRPDKLRVTIARPDPQEIVADGETIWHFDALLGQVTTQRQADTIGEAPLAMLLDGVIPDNAEIITSEDNDNLRRYRLRDANDRDIYLTFNNGVPTALDFFDGLNNPVFVTLTNVVINEAIDQERFTFVAPPDVTIVGR